MFLKKRFFKVFMIISFFILILVLGSYFVVRKNIYLNNKISFNDKVEDTTKNDEIDIGKTQNAVKEENKVKEESEYIENILLIGTDNRRTGEIGRSDAIVIATIDKKNNKIKFSSILRDTYVSIKNHGEDKINSAFAYGGAKLLLDTIYNNLDIKIDKYIIVDFFGFQNIIDKLGGIPIDIKRYEIKEINKYIGEVNKVKSKKINKEGVQILDGQQVLAYSRIRKVGNGSYERSKRQREVLNAVVEKVLSAKFIEYKDIIESLVGSTKTNIEPLSLIGYAFDISRMKDLKIEGIQIPRSEFSSEKTIKGSWVIWIDKVKNAEFLKNFIYES